MHMDKPRFLLEIPSHITDIFYSDIWNFRSETELLNRPTSG